MKNTRDYFWIGENQSLLWTSNWDYQKRIDLSKRLNVHGILNNYNSLDFLKFLCWEEFLNKILEFKNDLEKAWIEWLALDIDQTLSYTSLYWFEKLLKLYWNPEKLTANEMLEKYIFYENVPYWKENSDIIKKMYALRDDDEHQLEIPIIHWTNELYKMIHDELKQISAYITVRPEVVSNWTSVWLNNHGFPEADVIHIPNELEFMLWNLWKACILDILYPQIIWIVDDNPSLIKMLPKRYPWEIFLFNKENSCNYWHINFHICETIDDVKNNLQKVFG